jgi:mono/diheme cytochrome c family protein
LDKFVVVLSTLVALALVLVLFAFSGIYDVGADRPHTALVYALLDVVRERSIVRRAQTILVPSLDDPRRVREGAEHYSAMCVDCHLAPGLTVSEIRAGLLPAPPNLSQQSIDPRIAFWAIKHGIKATGMPAWGKTHDDEEIWNIVAFVQRLPHMSAGEYRAITSSTEIDEHQSGHDDHDHHHEHGHGDGEQATPEPQ